MSDPLGEATALDSGPTSRAALTVTVGQLALGLTSYGFLTIAARTLPAAGFSAVAVLWSLVYGLSGGLFLPLEQETTRAVAERVARQERVDVLVLRVAALGLCLLLVVDGALALFRGPLADRVFDGDERLVWALCLALAGMCGLFVTRGLLAGTTSYRRYGGQLAGEGLLRLAVAVVLVVADTATAGSLGLVVGLAPVAVLLVTLAVLPRVGGRPRAGSWPEVTQRLGLLLVASVVALGIANAGPIVLQLLGGVDRSLAGRFLAAFVLVRLPLFFTGPLQASLTPQLVQASERGDLAGFTAALRRLVAVVTGLGAVAVAGFAVLGPWAVGLLFGSKYAVGRVDLVVLTLSSLLLLVAALLQAGAVALGLHRAVAASWAAAGVVFVACCLVPLAPLPRIEVAYVVAGVVVLVLLGATLRRVARSWAASSPAGQRS